MVGLVNKRVKLFFQDISQVNCKEGVIISESPIFIEIKTFRGVEAIPTNKIVRCEVLS